MPTLEELKVLREKARVDQAAAKKASKKKEPKPRKDRHAKFTEGGEEQWQGSIAYPKKTIMEKGRERYDTYQLPTGEWSFSPQQNGDISLYGATANRAYGWDGKKVVVKPDASHMEVWWYDAQGVQRGLASSTQAIEARQKFQERMKWPRTS